MREAFIQQYGQFITSKGTVVIIREDTRSPSDNEKLALKQPQEMLDKAEMSVKPLESQPPELVRHETEQLRIRSTKSEAQVSRYKDRTIRAKKLRSDTKRNRKPFILD